MIRRKMPYYGVEAAKLEERLISGLVLTGAAAITALTFAVLAHVNEQGSEPPTPTIPTTTEYPSGN